jgi:septal ring factor EnvC (AmiA/AmiB activator)
MDKLTNELYAIVGQLYIEAQSTVRGLNDRIANLDNQLRVLSGENTQLKQELSKGQDA